MTAITMADAVLESTRAADNAAGGPADKPIACEQHLGHDFPYLTCCVCRFPVPPWDLAGTDFEHHHASTCTPTGKGAARATAQEWAS